MLVLTVAGLAIFEVKTSWFQSILFTHISEQASWSVQPGPSPEFRQPHSGPYDNRLGHSRLEGLFVKLEAAGWKVQSQSRVSLWFRRLMDWGLFPTYREKTQAGLQLLDQHNSPIYVSRWPERIYHGFDAVPPVVAHTLLFIENREILDEGDPRRNPAVEWDRLATAAVGLGLNKLAGGGRSQGGSTLATQLEKLRHSPDGVTPSVGEKFRQMVSASLRAYQDGRETEEARRRIVCDYLNSVPLAASPGYGEVWGLGDGLAIWFGADFDETNRLLAQLRSHPETADAATARAFREVLTLLLAIQRPTGFLVENRAALEHRAEQYLRLMAEAGIISDALRDRALQTKLIFRNEFVPKPAGPFSAHKGIYSVRVGLMQMLGLHTLYELDRLDLSAHTTLDETAQRATADTLRRLREPEAAAQAGLVQARLLATGDPSSVIYSVAVYERVGNANMVRIEADNYDQPLNINVGTKLELGSTAKLRTLVSYLEAVTELHDRMAGMSADQLAAIQPAPEDALTRWARDYMLRGDPAIEPMLDAALNRSYSASPAELFFTGGGQHQFTNFDGADNHRVVTVREAFHRSVNLVFIRLMRDLVRYRMYQRPDVTPALFSDIHNPARQAYLERFEAYEGRQFITEFYRKYHGLKVDMALQEMASGIRKTPKRLAVIFRTVQPDVGIDGFAGFLIGNLLNPYMSEKLLNNLYEEYSADKWSLADRGYLADVHPLELWVLAYLARHPDASLEEVVGSAEAPRHDSYRWLYLPSKKEAQDRAIRIMTEVDAFDRIHESWERQGYPFSWLVPSYATAIGSSGDTPAALAEQVGIILNGGVRNPTIRVDRLRFAEATPFETEFAPALREGKRVMSPEMAALLRREMIAVVDGGTAARAHNSMKRADGSLVVVGGKTGTGDNRRDTYGPGGRLIESKVINRTATFVFFFDDRFFGVITAYVPGEEASDYGFTSSLPAQLFRQLAPTFVGLMEKPVSKPDSAVQVARSQE